MQTIRVVKKFNSVLSKHQKFRVFELVVLMIVGGVLESISVSLILPFMNIIMEPDKTMQNGFAQFICDILSIESTKSFLFLLAIVLALIFIVKNAFLLFEYNIQYRFVYGNMFLMQERLLSQIINRPYESFLKIDSGEIVRIINKDTSQAFILLTSLLSFFSELVVSGMMIITVFVIAPMITLIMAVVILIIVLLINLFLKPILQKAGVETQISLAGMNKWLIQSVQGAKEMKVSSKEEFFEKKFSHYGRRYVASLRKNYVLGVLPRFVIEAISMSTMFLIVGFLIWSGTDIESIIPILTAVAMAAMRLLPSVNRITASLGNISYNEPMLDKLIENLESINHEVMPEYVDRDVMDDDISSIKKIKKFEKQITISNVTYSYPDSDDVILASSNLVVKKGESVGIVGASGAGKTTVVDVLLGLLSPIGGQVLIDDIDIQEDVQGFLGMVGYIPQSIFMLDDTIRANVAFGEERVSDEDVFNALEGACLLDFVESLPNGLDTEIGERGIRLSGGQIQRIGIARALYKNPAILVFDEATSALDNETEKQIMESIDRLKGVKTMIIIAHRLSTIENCDVVYRVEDGMILTDK